MKDKYGSDRYWKSGDEVEMTVDCRNYTISYKLNGRNLGVAAYNFNELLDSTINDRYYAIISIKRGQNSVTLLDAHRYKENRSRSINVSLHRHGHDEYDKMGHIHGQVNDLKYLESLISRPLLPTSANFLNRVVVLAVIVNGSRFSNSIRNRKESPCR